MAVRYTVEKLTSFLRSQVMVIVLTTMSTWLFCSARDPVGRRQDPVLDLRRRAEDVARDLAGDVDVETGDLAGDRVAEGEQVAADVEADDQPCRGCGCSRPPRRRRPGC